MSGFSLKAGFPESQRDAAARLFWSAFRGKLENVLGPEEKALGFLKAVLDPDYAISATAPDGTLLGLVGFKTDAGAFAGGEFADLRAAYGPFGGFWRGLLLELLDRKTEPGCLLMDGIFVSESARGQGIGKALLKSIFELAAERGLKRVRLDVIDKNTRAKSLYERMGFEPVSVEQTGLLGHVFNFSSATRMEKIISGSL
ncbi:GNAT family N-acetyltransferase [uncultured Roseibium sp.]|uniref:GNAT family N-acetyltransferase n=1 Tax=uncultured Roseibium sp. TaxID=1936171 RepID=UPI00261A5BDD|nr:GNAT family N-acetyltransferase [uncultured Roseibium sp.]